MNGTGIQKLLVAIGLMWLFGNTFMAAILWALFDGLGLSKSPVRVFLVLSVGVGIGALLLSLVVKDNYRVLVRAWLSALVIIAASSLCFAVDLVFLSTPHPFISSWVINGLFWSSLIWWCTREVLSYKQLIIKNRFMEREFYVDDTYILFRRPTKTKLDSPPISETTLFGKLYHRLGPYLVMGIPLAYPIQRLFSDIGGTYAVLLLMTVLSTPITFWVLGRMSCGAYLNIYKVWELEKKHGKPVLLEPS